MGEPSMRSKSHDRVRPLAQLASVLLLVVAMTVSVQLRRKPESPRSQLPPRARRPNPFPR